MTDRIAEAITSELDLLRTVCGLPYGDEARDRLAHDSAKYALELGHSTSLLLGDENTAAFNILLRSLVESIIKLAWGIQSPENAASIEIAAHNQFRRNLRSLMVSGALSFKDPTNGSTLDERILELAMIDKSHRPRNVREMATALGLEHLYQILYKNLSMHTHADASIVSPNPPRMTLEERALALTGALQTVKIVSVTWLQLKRAINPSELQKMMLH